MMISKVVTNLSKATIGIPKALLYYYYHPLWETFFKQLGFQVQVSSDTNMSIMNNGITACVDEACLPVKVFYGHVLELATSVDYIFLPRMVSVEPKEYICPKLLGLPDMIKANILNPPILINTSINLWNKKKNMAPVIKEIAEIIDIPFKVAYDAWRTGEENQKLYEAYLASGNLPHDYQTIQSKYPIGVLGHGYNIYDKFLSMNLIQKLQEFGVDVRTKEMVPKSIIESNVSKLPKKLFWTFGKQLMGSGLHYLNDKQIKGIIFVASFGCGPDSLIGELLERKARRMNEKPFLLLTIDEHTGQAGLITRVEAFMDMIKRRVS